MRSEVTRRLVAEALGTAFVLAAVVGSGIMAERLSGGNVGLALLCNALATGAALFALITIFAPISGAHFNPAVTMAAWADKALPAREALAFAVAQVGGGIAGVWLVHMMFAEPVLQWGGTERSGGGQWLAEAIATFGLVLVIKLLRGRATETIAAAVALYIVAAYWFTASTSFANPAVTLARALSDSFAGIRPVDAPGFVVAQLLGAAAATMVGRALAGKPAAR